MQRGLGPDGMGRRLGASHTCFDSCVWRATWNGGKGRHNRASCAGPASSPPPRRESLPSTTRSRAGGKIQAPPSNPRDGTLAPALALRAPPTGTRPRVRSGGREIRPWTCLSLWTELSLAYSHVDRKVTSKSGRRRRWHVLGIPVKKAEL